MRWRMCYVCACCLVFFLHDSNSGFDILTVVESHAVTWIWTETCCDLVHVCLDLFLVEHDRRKHFGFDCPWNAFGVAGDCEIARETAWPVQKMTLTWPVFACLETCSGRRSSVGAWVRVRKRASVCDHPVGSCSPLG